MSSVNETSPKVAVSVAVADEDLFTGGNPRPRSLPGQAPGEVSYEKTRDGTGRLVSKKPANGPFLAHQRWKEEEVERKARKARGEKPLRKISPKKQWTPWRIFKWFLILIAGIMALGNFLVKSPFWGFEDQIVKTYRSLVTPQKAFTPAELSAFDGQDASKPVYLGIDGDVYDVTASRRIYGPLGPYHVMAGRDASRAFITGCFQTHLTHDLRGLSSKELGALSNWKTFFAKHAKYHKVGTVEHPPIDESTPIPEPCEPPSTVGGAPDAVPASIPHVVGTTESSKGVADAAPGQVNMGRQEL
ncbi:hypothetical protein QFC21_002047 [Naganishia friedmannii]|uniref:Uncharacterized protein n=1 Tax=Naganishia friedmannii TaxID=89922 RepID=A0ACC2W098_9TREE|nr:hypothetical protein QFC21_002047 [Naganishia friedmannii]